MHFTKVTLVYGESYKLWNNKSRVPPFPSAVYDFHVSSSPTRFAKTDKDFFLEIFINVSLISD